MTNPTRFRIDDVRADWPVLFKGEQYKGAGKYRCGIKLVIEPTHPQFKQITAAIEAAAQAKWKDKWQAQLKIAKSKDNVCLRDGDLQAKAPEGYAGNWVLSANCAGGDTEAECVKPQIFDKNRVEVTDPSKNPVYRGCYVNALVEFYGDDRHDTGVHCKLVGVQFWRDGDAFGSPKARADDFMAATDGSDAGDIGWAKGNTAGALV